MIAESLTRPGYFQGYPLVLTPAARAGHGARPPGRPVHNRGVELDLAEQVRQPAHADMVIGLVGFPDADGGLDRVQGAAAGAEQGHTRGQADLTTLAGDHLGRYGSSS